MRCATLIRAPATAYDMASFRIKCSECGREYPPNAALWRCECGRPLDVHLDLSDVDVSRHTFAGRPCTMWRYGELLPSLGGSVVSLGEGMTPVVEASVGGASVTYKLDYVMPTGSFKDRGASVSLTRAKWLGLRAVVEDSSGNAGAAIAAYSSAAGIACKVFVPRDAPEGKVLQIRSYGAEVVRVEGSRAEVNAAALREAERSGAHYIGHLWDPFFIEGIKTLAYEAAEQVGWRGFDAVVVPVGSGGLLLGVWKGFRELAELGLIDSPPRVYGVQAVSCAPVYELLHGARVGACEREPLADGIAVPNPPRGPQVARAVKEAGGDIVLVEDGDIVAALRELAKMGLFVEPTSATALAALRKLIESGQVDRGESVLLPLTGFGLKALDKLIKRRLL